MFRSFQGYTIIYKICSPLSNTRDVNVLKAYFSKKKALSKIPPCDKCANIRALQYKDIMHQTGSHQNT